MRVGFLTGKLTPETVVVIKDINTGKVIWTGNVAFANFNDTVKDWDFSNGHVIYIGEERNA